MANCFDLRESSDGQFMFNLKAENGETVLTSELYVSRSGALEGIASVKANAGDESRYERRVSVGEEPYFVLKAENGEVIGTSEMYSSVQGMERGILVVRDIAAGAEVVEPLET